jgi:hypothetical protein
MRNAVKTNRMDITVDFSSHYIFVQQKWKYNWIDNPSDPWTLEEKRLFHNKADQLIWKFWSSKAYAMITGNSRLAGEYRNIKFNINVDIKWTIGSAAAHWNVEVVKNDARSNAHWTNQQARLDIYDIYAVDRPGKLDTTQIYAQYPVVHEVGHLLGNTIHIQGMHGDEYKEPQLSLYSDENSVMNIGNAVRDRHFDYLKSELKRLLKSDIEIHI